MVEGSKLILDSFSEFEDNLKFYDIDRKTSYLFGFKDALDKFDEILDYLSTYAPGENLKEYFVLYTASIEDIIESGEHRPEIKKSIEEIDLLKKGEYISSEHLWKTTKDHIEKII